MAATVSPRSTRRKAKGKPLLQRASFILGLTALVFAFVLALMGKLDSSDFTFIAIAVAGGQHVVNGIERK